MRPLFPRATTPKRSSFYVVDLNEASGKELLGALKKSDAIEFAEPAVQRKLVNT